LKVFENKVHAIWVHFEWGEPFMFELIDKRQNKSLCKDFIENRARLYQYNHTSDILSDLEKWLEENNSGSGKSRNKKLHLLAQSNGASPM
jgi:hypothetical protein